MNVTASRRVVNPACAQLDLFEPVTLPSSPAPLPVSPIAGLTVSLPGQCRCGCRLGVIGSSSGLHEHRIDCKQCGNWRQWLGKTESDFIRAISEKFGAPPTPIIIRPRGHL
jgi:hypothetical protein